MDISLLPPEIFEVITSNLTLPDILACCSVSVKWRNCLNNNRIWRNLCAKKFNLKQDSYELVTKQGCVQPKFVFPENKSNRFAEVCHWRLRFMQELHVSKNWRNGRYVREPITIIDFGEILESEGDLIIVPSNKICSFTPWCMEDPIVKKHTVPFSLCNMMATFFKLCGGKLVVAQCTLLQIYVKTKEDEFVLKNRFLFNKPFVDSENIPKFADITEWYIANVGLYPCDISMCCDHDGKYFVGVIQENNLNNPVLHIWDISAGTKYEDQLIPVKNEHITYMHFTLNNSNIFLFLGTTVNNNKRCTKVYCFSLVTFTYTSLYLHFDYALPAILVRDPYMLTLDNKGHHIYIWKLPQGELAHKVYSEYVINPKTIQFASSFVIFCGISEFSKSMVKIVNIETLQTVNEFFIDFHCLNITLIRSELMLIGSCKGLSVWDITSGTKLHNEGWFCFNPFVIWANSNYSKIACETENNEVYLLHFW